MHTGLSLNFLFLYFELRPSHTAAVTKTITVTMQIERILLVELLHAEYTHTLIQPIECVLFASLSLSFSLVLQWDRAFRLFCHVKSSSCDRDLVISLLTITLLGVYVHGSLWLIGLSFWLHHPGTWEVVMVGRFNSLGAGKKKKKNWSFIIYVSFKHWHKGREKLYSNYTHIHRQLLEQ